MKPRPPVMDQRPVGIPNRSGICCINVVPIYLLLQMILSLFIDSLSEVYRKPLHDGGDVVQFLTVLNELSPFLPKITAATRFFRQEKGAIKSYPFKIPMPFI